MQEIITAEKDSTLVFPSLSPKIALNINFSDLSLQKSLTHNNLCGKRLRLWDPFLKPNSCLEKAQLEVTYMEIAKNLSVELESTWFYVGILPCVVEYWLLHRGPGL